MGVNMKRWLLFGILAVTWASQNAFSITTYDLNWKEVNEDYLIQDHPFAGNFERGLEGSGLICRMTAAIKLSGEGTVKWATMKPLSENEVEIKAELRDLYGRVDGSQRSDATFCFTT